MLLHSPSGLQRTDAPAHVIDALSASAAYRKSTWLLARRGPVQATFSTKEFRELVQLPQTRVTVSARDMELNEASIEEISADRAKKRKMDIMEPIERLELDSSIPPQDSRRLLRLAFNWRPVSFIADPARPGWVGGIELRRQVLGGVAGNQQAHDAALSGDAGGFETRIIPAQFVLRSIGYRANPIVSVPFDAQRRAVPTMQSRVLESGVANAPPLRGVYAAGWLRRGPVGIVGTNIADAQQVVEAIESDLTQHGTSVRRLFFRMRFLFCCDSTALSHLINCVCPFHGAAPAADCARCSRSRHARAVARSQLSVYRLGWMAANRCRGKIARRRIEETTRKADYRCRNAARCELLTALLRMVQLRTRRGPLVSENIV